VTGTTRTSDGLDPRRRRALFRAWHRGTREMDLLLGTFADGRIGDLSADDLATFEDLMEVPDRDLFAWLTGKEPVAPNYDSPVYRAIEQFHATRHDEEH
jgi:antitoxin CptB